MIIDIKHWINGTVLASQAVDDKDPTPWRTALERTVAAGTLLAGADLSGKNLSDARLNRARLDHARLNHARLDRTCLTGADLTGADLTGADLTDADLTDADLTGANLSGTDLHCANLNRTRLAGSNLYRAHCIDVDFTGADLGEIRIDFRFVLDAAPAEVAGLLTALRAGQINGSSYVGECCCLVGTIGKLQGVSFGRVPGIVPNDERPAERWFTAISGGDTPDTNPVAAIVDDWICEWQTERGEGDWICKRQAERGAGRWGHQRSGRRPLTRDVTS